ncbi:hypothetical protein HZB78_04325 [Candidatus Collierbacteria bacterium]|nr:hypothetical protein [Candidatus Collierbacteria bacterium]
MSNSNINMIIAGSLERAKVWIKEGDDPNDIYQALAPAILEINQKLLVPAVSPTRDLENLLRTECGWSPVQNTSGSAAKWGPC